MAVTRINNNQITTASSGNAYLGINAAAKLQNYSITSNKIANSLVYGSDLTISGNLTVNGTTTTIDTVNTLIQDPLITLADGQTTGTPTVDIGLIGLRGSQDSSFIGWKEDQTEFVAALSNTTVSNTTANITSYANFHANTITAAGNLSVVGNIVGNINFSGNITAGNLISNGIVSAVSNITGGNVLTSGLVSATSNVTGGNLLTSGLISATATITGGNVLTSGLVSATSNITGGNVLTSGLVSATGNVYGGNVSTAGNVTANYFIGNISGNIDAAGSNTQIQFNTIGDILGANANFTYDYATNLMTVNGGNIQTGNLLTGGLVSATGNVTGGNLITTGNVYAPAIVNNGLFNSQISIDGVSTGIIAVTTNGNSTQFLPSGQISLGGVSQVVGGTFSGSGFTAGPSQTDLFQNRGGNVTVQVGTGGSIANTWTFAQSGALLAPGAVSAVGNVTGGNVLTGGLVSASGNITSATNVNTPNVVATGNLELSGGNILLTPTGNIVVNNKNINGVSQPVQSNDVATKIYVDNMVSTQIAYHQAVQAATISNLATATGGTITYTQPNGAGNGVGALISTTGAFNLIDTSNVQTANTRILVKNEGNAALNGVYYWANATTIIRTLDADVYGPNSAEELSINDYFFVTSGNVNAGSAWIVDAPAGEITFGTSNIAFAQFSSSQTYTGGNGISLYGTVISTVYDNSTIGVNGSNQLYIPANAPLVTPNIGAATGTSLSVTGAITAGTTLSSVGNTIAGNILTAGLVSATGNLTSGNVNTAIVSATGQIVSTATGNLDTGGGQIYLNGTGNNRIDFNTQGTGAPTFTTRSAGTKLVLFPNLSGSAADYAFGVDSGVLWSGVPDTSGQFKWYAGTTALANLSGTGAFSAAGNITGANILTAGLISSAGNINTSANIIVTGTGNINGYNAYFSNSVSVLANLYTSGNVVAVNAGIFYGNSVTGNGAIYAGLPSYTPLGSNVVTQFSGNANSYSQINFQNISDGTSASTDYIATANNGTDTTYYLDMGINGNTFNDPVNYPGFGPNDSYVHNHGGNLILNPESAGKAINFMVGGTDTTNVIATMSNTQLSVNGIISATGNITGSNVVGITSGQFGNIVITGDDITDTNGRVNFNTAGADVDFAVNGDTVANIFYVDAGNGTASFGNSTQQSVNALVSFNAATSVVLPAGTTVQRPSNASSTSGMIRFNTTSNSLEIFNNSEWTTVGGTTFTVIADEQFNGDGSNVAFTLASTQTTNSCIVSINGIVQIPGTAYSVAGTDPTCVLTFTEAPSIGDLIDVREITTTTTVTAIQNNSGNATVTGNSAAAQIDVLGNLVPTGNVTYDLGSSSNYWKSLYVGGNTIYLGGLQLKSATGNVFNITTSDGTTPATLGNTTISGTGNVTAGNVSVTGNVVGAIYTNSIVNSGANGTGNIGSSSTYFNTVFAKATSAQYADLAEKYVADAEYAPGTVVSFGGDKEVTVSAQDGDRAVAGVVSTNPSYIMNATLEAEYVAVVAFTGRVPTSVTGTVAKGDLMVSNGDGTARSEADPKAGAIIGKALENFSGETGTIEVVIGRF